MPLQSIVVVFLRLFSVQSLFTSIVSIIALWGNPALRIMEASSLCWLTTSFLVWFLAQPFAQLVTRGVDVSVPLGGLTRQDLYCFAFVFVGLGCFLHSFAAFLSSCGVMISDAIATSASQQIDHAGVLSVIVRSVISQLPRQATETLLGLITILFANNWSKKLVSREN
jgi:hypothetical protein